MPRESIQSRILKGTYPSKEAFVEYYIEQNHSQTDTAIHFGISRAVIQSLISYWSIKKAPEQICLVNAETSKTNKRSVSYKVSTGEYPSEKDLKDYYIAKNHSRKDTAEHFGITESGIVSLLEYYNIHKTGNEISLTKKKTCVDRYGVSTNLKLEECKAKIRQTCESKYGVEHISQVEAIKEKRKDTFIAKYGVKYVLQNEEVKKKVQETVKEKYGVEWPCQIESCKRSGHGQNSKPNQIFEKKLEERGCDFSREYNLGDYSFDFKIGEVLIEIDPWFTHQSSLDTKFGKKTKEYHANKTNCAVKNGFHCVHVFDWDDQDKIIDIFLGEKEKCYARMCDVKIVEEKEETDFLNKYHLQGYVKSDECIGLYYRGELVQLMSFGKPRYNKTYDYELLRLCSSKCVVGGASKLFKCFINKHKGKTVISYCDLSKFSGEVYEKLGFVLLRKSIGKHWYSPKLKKHITDNLLRQHGFDRLLGKTFECFGKGSNNDTLMLEHGFVEIYDAGQASYIYIN